MDDAAAGDTLVESNREMRFFSTAGPVRPAEHYHIPPLSRSGLDEVLGLVRDRKYFVVHAPRQTGKTSALLALADLLNERGYHCVYVTLETARTARNDVARAVRLILAEFAEAADEALNDRFPGVSGLRFSPTSSPAMRCAPCFVVGRGQRLARWCC